MHPILETLKSKVLVHTGEAEIFRHIGASNLASDVYTRESLRRMWSMAPYSQSYFSVLNPLFSSLLEDYNKKDLKYPVVLIRDGLVDFLQHMFDNPVPTKNSQVYIFDQRLEPYLNNAWREKALFYSLYHRPNPSYKLPVAKKRLIISTIVNGAFVSSSRLEALLAQAKSFVSKHNLAVEVHLPVRENIFYDHAYQDDPAVFDLSKKFYDTFDHNIKFISDKKITMDSDFRDSYYLIPSDSNLCLSDNYLEHTLLMKGAAPMSDLTRGQGLHFEVALSSEHGAVLGEGSGKFDDSLFKDLSKEAVTIKKMGPAMAKDHQFKYFANQLSYGDFFKFLRSTLQSL
ncbi:MAG: hypothetical protein CME71_11965 [Halobacteriovorax sp.]|nr:hypothetical protein [Halobacteriovorax sp.]